MKVDPYSDAVLPDATKYIKIVKSRSMYASALPGQSNSPEEEELVAGQTQSC